MLEEKKIESRVLRYSHNHQNNFGIENCIYFNLLIFTFSILFLIFDFKFFNLKTELG